MEKIIKLLIIQIGFLVLGILLSMPIYLLANESVAQNYLIISGVFLGNLFLIAYILLKKYVRFDSRSWSFCSMKVLLLTIVLNLVFFFFANGVDGLIDYLDNKDLYEKLGMLKNMGLDPLGFCVIVLVSPIAEELMFRGSILRLLLEKKNLAPRYAILIAALISGILNPGQNVSSFLFGLLWGYLYYRSGSLSLCILSDMITNILSTMLIIHFPDSRSVYDLVGIMPFVGFAVLSVILSVICIYYLSRSLTTPAWRIPETPVGNRGSDALS